MSQQVPDTAQASEKISMAAKKALKVYVKKLEDSHQNLEDGHKVEIVPIGSPWTSATSERMVRLIKGLLGDSPLKVEIVNGWNAAFV